MKLVSKNSLKYTQLVGIPILIVAIFIYQSVQIQQLKDKIANLNKNSSFYTTITPQGVVDYLNERENLLTFKIGEKYSQTELTFTLSGDFKNYSNEQLTNIQNDFFRQIYKPQISKLTEYNPNNELVNEEIQRIHQQLLSYEPNQIPLICASTFPHLDGQYDVKITHEPTERIKEYSSNVMCVKEPESKSQLDFISFMLEDNVAKINYRWEDKILQNSYKTNFHTLNILPIMLTEKDVLYFGEMVGGGGWSGSSLIALDLKTNTLTKNFECNGAIENNSTGTYGTNCIFWETSLLPDVYKVRENFNTFIKNIN